MGEKRKKTHRRQCLSSLKKNFSCKETLRQVFIYLSPRNPIPPPLHTVYVYTVYVFTQGRGGGETQRLGRATVHKTVSKKCQNDWLYLQSINYNKHLPQSPFTVNFFRWRHFALVSIHLISPWEKERQRNDDFHKRYYSTVCLISAGFGNKPTDVEAYREIGLSPRRIFIVNKVRIAVLYLAKWFWKKVLEKRK